VQDKLSRINDEHKTFIYSVSHDLRGPLSNLKTCISLLKIELEPKFTDLFELVSMTDNSINNLTEIIRELTDVVKIETEIEVPEIVNLKELLPEVELILKDRFVNLKYKINYDIKEPEIQFSKKNLRSILFNILSNAMKYRSPDRELELTIRTEKLNGELRLSIQDNGLGIAESQRSKIFGAFHRAHDHVEGIGVGLYLVKKIINNAGGDIEVDSEVGKGSNFMVYFPKRQKV
jgi:signal transduction histidine kinase